MHPAADTFHERLLDWYDRGHRALPWRISGPDGKPDPWHILLSEFMLQQTRVEAVVPYFLRFLKQFPDARSLAEASEADALAAWSGLGYYSRIRNLQRAAQMVADRFPPSYEGIRELPGVGPYTAAAVASIGFDLPYAVADGNVFRVMARFTADAGDIASQTTRLRLTAAAQSFLDPSRPGDFNQAIMELGATVCLPRSPQCLLCPIAAQCQARQQGRQSELPVKRSKSPSAPASLDVIILERDVPDNPSVLLRQRTPDERRMPGFWELPALDAVAPSGPPVRIGSFAHSIVNTRYQVQVWRGAASQTPAGMEWFALNRLAEIPVTTVSRKALAQAYPLRTIVGNARFLT